ncbi:rhodanese-like domain-containing protein [Alpinimonas psychrophila]
MRVADTPWGICYSERMKKIFAFAALALATVFVLTACAPAAAPIVVSQGTVIIDVRTPAEFAGGHLEGAVNIDVESTTFAATVSKLPTAGTYVVYCKSGNRAGQAITQMKSLGFTDMVNAGSVAAASSATGLAIVQ